MILDVNRSMEKGPSNRFTASKTAGDNCQLLLSLWWHNSQSAVIFSTPGRYSAQIIMSRAKHHSHILSARQHRGVIEGPPCDWGMLLLCDCLITAAHWFLIAVSENTGLPRRQPSTRVGWCGIELWSLSKLLPLSFHCSWRPNSLKKHQVELQLPSVPILSLTSRPAPNMRA